MRLGLALFVALAAACGGGGDGGGDGGSGQDSELEPPLPTGGWSTSDDSLYACFDNTNRADFSASRADVAENACCVWTGEGTGQIVFPTSNTATWEMLNLETLEITLDPPCEGAGCDAVVYRRNPTLTCFP